MTGAEHASDLDPLQRIALLEEKLRETGEIFDEVCGNLSRSEWQTAARYAEEALFDQENGS